MEEIEKPCWTVTFKALAVFGGIMAAGAVFNIEPQDRLAGTDRATQVSAAPAEVVTD